MRRARRNVRVLYCLPDASSPRLLKCSRGVPLVGTMPGCRTGGNALCDNAMARTEHRSLPHLIPESVRSKRVRSSCATIWCVPPRRFCRAGRHGPAA
jgi:hypothetical protein